ncbi:MAG TPA: sterol desaturase family protein [Pyrinomonadaceae bacterium]|nr:sterol desaturase family protein [Pyrinomonadaceae bacterium]
MQFIALTILGFVGLELFSYFVHRWLFHGVLWRVHRTHHAARKGWFELNDLFSGIFASVSILLIIFAEIPLLDSSAFPIGLGIAIYGAVYFIAHDLFTHRRFLPFNSPNKLLLTVRAAHQKHHQTAEKQGIEPFGLFIFDYAKFWRKKPSPKTKKAEIETNPTSA